MHNFHRVSSFIRANTWAWILAVVFICAGLGFAAARHSSADDLPAATVAAVTASLGPGMAKIAMDRIDPSTAPDTNAASPQAAPSLATLLPGLEAKVAANPADFSLRFLLAQTYVELEQYAQAIPLVDALRREAPQHPQLALLSVKAHLPSADPASLRTALHTLQSLNRDAVDAVDLWLLRGKVLARLGERAAARDAWLQAQTLLPPGDARATDIDRALAHLAHGVNAQ